MRLRTSRTIPANRGVTCTSNSWLGCTIPFKNMLLRNTPDDALASSMPDASTLASLRATLSECSLSEASVGVGLQQPVAAIDQSGGDQEKYEIAGECLDHLEL